MKLLAIAAAVVLNLCLQGQESITPQVTGTETLDGSPATEFSTGQVFVVRGKDFIHSQNPALDAKTRELCQATGNDTPLVVVSCLSDQMYLLAPDSLGKMSVTIYRLDPGKPINDTTNITIPADRKSDPFVVNIVAPNDIPIPLIDGVVSLPVRKDLSTATNIVVQFIIKGKTTVAVKATFESGKVNTPIPQGIPKGISTAIIFADGAAVGQVRVTR